MVYNTNLSYSKDAREELPKELVLRQIKVRVKPPGFRTRWFHILTSLLDATRYPAEELAELYFKRWDVELFFRDIKTTMGLVVDDAIIMVENVERHIRAGRTPLNAAIVAARELAGPFIAMTVTLAAVYAPIGLQGGLVGRIVIGTLFTLFVVPSIYMLVAQDRKMKGENLEI